MFRSLLPLLCLFSLSNPSLAQKPDPGLPSPKERALALVHEASALMERGDAQGAVKRLLAAQMLLPDPSLSYNLGIAYAECGHHPQAAAALSHFLARADGSRFTADRLEDARARLAVYEKDLSRILLRAAAGGVPTSVLIDQRPVGLPVQEPLWLTPGGHELRVSAPGHRDYAVRLTLAAGERREVSVRLDPLAAHPSALVPPSALELMRQHEPPPVYRRWWFWVGCGGTLAFATSLIAVAATGGFAVRAPGTDLDPVDVAP